MDLLHRDLSGATCHADMRIQLHTVVVPITSNRSKTDAMRCDRRFMNFKVTSFTKTDPDIVIW